MNTLTVLWPQRRYVDQQIVNLWYSDAVANRELDEGDDGIPDEDWVEQARALHNAGVITLQRW